ncbi:PREDICTED: WAS/WASL-interacting protein family member 3 [Chinchilla lanigera]|uniref:WAS/WASL-interacting protein family member 3 n=1 Tax=Chinchilla lanigera TaxID=34839 RepID=UPI000697B780|nr:PREDICTED: WAS/WASL-interacting protein family member 3 [Chinchilla lanigera]
MAAALRCACALALGCLASLLLRPEGARGAELQVPGAPEPRVAGWFSKLGPLGKYMEKIFGSSAKKPTNQKPEPAANATSPPTPPSSPTPPPRKAPELGPPGPAPPRPARAIKRRESVARASGRGRGSPWPPRRGDVRTGCSAAACAVPAGGQQGGDPECTATRRPREPQWADFPRGGAVPLPKRDQAAPQTHVLRRDETPAQRWPRSLEAHQIRGSRWLRDGG